MISRETIPASDCRYLKRFIIIPPAGGVPPGTGMVSSREEEGMLQYLSSGRITLPVGNINLSR
jgi:hypothetical protein